MKRYLVLLLLFGTLSGKAQQQNIWAFGMNAGLDFNNPSPAATTSGIVSAEASASICDAGGNLLFYTNGYSVWDRNNNLMPGGSGLLTDPLLPPITINTPPDYTSSTTQGALIVPIPGQAQRYYIFSLTSAEFGTSEGRLYYSIVDMSLNNGLGDIVPGQAGIFMASGLTEHMIGVVGDRCNVWLLAIDNAQNQLKAFSIDATGIDNTPVLSPLIPVNNFVILGSMSISPDRRKLAISRLGAGLYDFDPVTGQASGGIALMQPATGTTAYGACFSPDNSKLYVTFVPPAFGAVYLSYQFDLSSGNPQSIINSAAILSTDHIFSFKRGPNGRIYTESLGMIPYPNLPVPACQYISYAIPFEYGTSSVFGLPNEVPLFHRDTVYSSQEVKAPCFSEGIVLGAVNDSTGWDYVWNDSTAGAQHTIAVPGTYYVQYYTAPCTDRTDTFHVTFPGGNPPDLQEQSSCFNTANGKAWIVHPGWDSTVYAYEWRDTGNTVVSVTDSLLQAASGNYTVRITTASGCDTLIAFTLPELTDTVAFIADTLVCRGDNISFTNTSAAGYTGFYWDFGDGSAGTTQANPAHTYTQPGLYLITLTGNGAICTDTATMTIIVDAPMTDTSLFIDRNTICTGEAVTFTSTTDSTLLLMEWSFGDQTGMTVPPGPVRHAYDAAGAMPVHLRLHFRACPDIDMDRVITVYPIPQVYLGPDTSICLQGNPILLANLAPPVPGSSCQWSTGDTGATLIVKHDGLYKLFVTSQEGCKGMDEITVAKGCYIDIPNAFTPNGDDVNDYFFPRQLLSDRLTGFHMQVFNRWGELVFETNRTDGRGWDGRFNDMPQPEGVYIYRIGAVIDGVHAEEYNGNVTLLR